MATKTLILRPINATTIKIGSSNKAGTSVTPSDTLADAYHTLLSEEFADNDATFIMIKNGYCIDTKFEVFPQDIQITDIKIMVTATTPSGTTSESVLTYEFYKTVDNTLQLIDSLSTNVKLIDLAGSYARFACESPLFTQELITNPSLDYTFRLQTPAINVELNVTQIYIEITYEVPDYQTIYYYNNGEWNTISCKIYQKINGVWKESSDKTFVENERFNLNLL